MGTHDQDSDAPRRSRTPGDIALRAAAFACFFLLTDSFIHGYATVGVVIPAAVGFVLLGSLDFVRRRRR